MNKFLIWWLFYFYIIGNKNVIIIKFIEIDKVIRLSLRLLRKIMYSLGKYIEDFGNFYGDFLWVIMCVFNSLICLKIIWWMYELLLVVYYI